jgi:hypothetical protein
MVTWETVVRAARDVQHAADKGIVGKRDADRLAALVLLFHAQTTTVLRSVGRSP